MNKRIYESSFETVCFDRRCLAPAISGITSTAAQDENLRQKLEQAQARLYPLKIGGYTVDVEWRGGKLLQGTIHAKFDGKCRVRTDSPVTVSSNGERVSYTMPEENVVEFDVKAGKTYKLSVRTSTRQR